MDAYYRDLAHLSLADRARFNFDAPDALEHELLLTHLRALKRGDSVDIPEYDYSTHTRVPATRPVAPRRWIILEGLYAFYWEPIRALTDTRIFIETPLALCLERRIARDTHERGRTEASVREQFAATVQHMYDLHCAPTAQFARIVLPGDGPVEEAADRVMTRLYASMAHRKEHSNGT
jgi:uridine kinase